MKTARILSPLIFLLFVANSALTAQADKLNIIAFGGHPDDCDLCGGGTAALWAAMGHNVKFVSLTNGDAGHQSMGGGALAKRRRAEAIEAGKRLGIAEYEVLDNHDGELLPSLDVRLQVIRRIRQWNADVVIIPRPNDYHPDHRNTSIVVQDAAYMVIVPNVASDTPPLKKNPVFLFCQDRFQKPDPFDPVIAIDIDASIDRKFRGLDAHVSQFYEWLPWTVGALEFVPEGKEDRLEWLKQFWQRAITPEVRESLSKRYGSEYAAHVQYAEAFEICEYGSQPSEEDIIKLFPMLPATPQVISKMTKKTPQIDGHLDEEIYGNLTKYPLMNNMTGASIEGGDLQSYFQLYHDKENMYVAFSNVDRKIHSSFLNRDDHLWEEEAVEVFIDTDENPHDYVEIEVSPANVFFDSYIVDPFHIDVTATKAYDLKNHKTGVHVKGTLNNNEDEDQGWDVEISIPFNELVKDYQPDLLSSFKWKINFYRIERDVDGIPYRSWSPTFLNFHQPAKFGMIRFED